MKVALVGARQARKHEACARIAADVSHAHVVSPQAFPNIARPDAAGFERRVREGLKSPLQLDNPKEELCVRSARALPTLTSN